MAIVNNELSGINFIKNFTYAKFTPTLTSCNIGIADEIARWILDRNAILYKNKLHGARIVQKKIKGLLGKFDEGDSPCLQMTDAFIYGADSIVQYFENRCTAKNKLIPTDSKTKDEVMDLYTLFTGEFFEKKVTRFLLGHLLNDKKLSMPVLTQGTPFLEKIRFKLFFSMLKSQISKTYELKSNSAEDNLKQIQKIFTQVNDLLKDGRKFLVGNQFTLADLSFAAAAAPLILPIEFGGVLPGINQVSDSYRTAVQEMRNSAAGQFVFKMYLEQRPLMLSQKLIPKEPNFIAKALAKFVISLKKKQSNLFFYLQKSVPVLKLPFIKLMVVSRHDLLVELLDRDLDFTIEEINNRNMSEQKGAFFLGWDRNNPQMNRERDFVRKATKREDLEIIRKFVRETSEEILRNAQPFGKVDVAESFAKVVITRLCEFYFGATALTETTFKYWCRILFFDLFLNLKKDKALHEEAIKAGIARGEFLFQLIKNRRQELKDGKTLADNLFNRMILMEEEPGNEWVDDDVIQRNIGGLLTGILEGTNKSVLLILDELFNKPQALKQAIEVAHGSDMNAMYGYVSEALRFNPTQPGVIRYSVQQQTLSGKGTKKYKIQAKCKVLALTAAAMQDPIAFPDPKKFIGDRKDVRYMNYGYGLHECYGKYINAVTLTEMVAAILRLKNVRRAEGRIGRGTGLSSHLLPTNFVVEFN